MFLRLKELLTCLIDKMPGPATMSKSFSDFDPRSVGGCQLWLDASDKNTLFQNTAGTTPSTNGTNVQLWKDKSGNGLNFSNATTAPSVAIPTYTNTSSTLSYVVFPYNSSTYLATTASTLFNTAAWDMYCIFQPNTASTYMSILTEYNSSAGPIFGTGITGTPTNYSVYNGSGTWQLAPTTGPSTYGVNQLYQLYSTGTVIGRRTNGLFTGSGTDQTATTSWVTRTGTHTIGIMNVPGYQWQYNESMYLSEIIVYNQVLTSQQRQAVEGYLAWKWGLQTSPSTFIPTSISGCQVWLDGADQSTASMTLSGTNVSVWKDKSGNGNNFTATTAATFSATYNALYFNSSLYSSSYSANPSTETVFIVARPTVTTSGGALISGYSGARAIWVGNSGGGGNGSVGIADTGIAWLAYTSAGTVVSNTTYLVVEQINAGTSYIGLNGTTTFNTGGASFGAGTVTYLGLESGASFPFVGYAMEIIFYNVYLSSTQRQKVEAYLSKKWSISVPTNILVSPHAFSLVRPLVRQFNPSDFAGLVVWSDANDYSTLGFGSSPALSTWYNKASSNAGYSTTLTGSPTWLSSGGPNGLPIVRFNSTTPATWTVTSDPVSIPYTTLFWMGRQNGGSNGRVLANTNSGTCNALYGYWGTKQQVLYLQNNPNLLVGIASSTAWGMFSFSQNCNLEYQMNWFGSNLYSGTTNGMPGIVGLGINKFGTEYSDCDVCEILVYCNVLTTTQIQQVEGYLAWKWGLNSYLSNGHPFYKISTASPSIFSPTNIASCVLWLDASDINTFNSSSSITRWYDKSGNLNNCIANTATTLTSLAINGLSALSFTNSQWLNGNISITGATITVFSVFNMTASAGGAARIISLGATNTNDYASTSYMGILRQSSSGIGPFRNGTYVSSSTPYNTTVVHTVYFDGTNGYTYTNSGTVSSYAFSANFAISSYTIATDTNNADSINGPFNGYIGEVIVYSNALSFTQRQQVEGYLAWKWGLVSSLPSTHPFKKFSPSQLSQPVPVSSVTISIASTTITASWTKSIEALNYTVSLYSASSSAGPFTTLVSTQTITGVLTTTFTVSSTNYYEVFVTVNGAGGQSSSVASSYVSYTVSSGRTYTFTGYTNSPGAPISYINSSSVTNGATTFTGSAGTSETNVFYSYTNDISAPVAKGVTKNTSRDTINLPANTNSVGTTFLSYGPYNTSYTLAGSMPTGFSTSAHTVIMIMYHLGTTGAISGSGGEGSGNVVASGGILYTMGRTSTGGNFNIAGEVVTGENGAWDYNGGFSMSINNTTPVNIQSKVGWVMVAFVWRASNTCIYYYNGGTVNSSGGGNGASSMAGTIYIGVDQRDTYYNGVPGNCLNAEIAFYGLWNSALTSTQIGAFYTQHSSQFAGGFV